MAYLIQCINLSSSQFEAFLDPVSGEFIVKDKGDVRVYGVWRVRSDIGSITPQDTVASARNSQCLL